MPMIIVCDQLCELRNLLELSANSGIDDARGFIHPAAALDWCEANVPDLVLVDFLMRATDGVEFIRRLRTLPALDAVPVVLMLPQGFVTVARAARREGASDFLAKPVDPTEFATRVGNLLAMASIRAAGSYRGPATRGRRAETLLSLAH